MFLELFLETIAAMDFFEVSRQVARKVASLHTFIENRCPRDTSHSKLKQSDMICSWDCWHVIKIFRRLHPPLPGHVNDASSRETVQYCFAIRCFVAKAPAPEDPDEAP